VGSRPERKGATHQSDMVGEQAWEDGHAEAGGGGGGDDLG